MLQHRSPLSYNAERGPVYLAVTAKRNRRSIASDLSRQLSSALFSYRDDGFKADRVQTLRAHWSICRLVFNTKHFKVVASSTSTIFVFGEDTSAIRKLDRCLQECEYGNCREDAFNSTKLLDSQLAVLNDLRYVRSVADLGIEQAREE
ncbi:hypothetical protein TNCV_4701621 [Trichonephila clavipes]|uniref:Uncharacterized protein n=1 Tax=Trichonephila clavipes TaxID=2585209 RepID=A0A8X7BLE5_TRICX|nr:hypothetical protein TNCV_4701621 [Trichonephila clavipes]